MIFDHYQNVKSKYQNISRPEVFCEKGVVRNFAKFTGKHLCQAFFLNKVAGLRPQLATLLKESLCHTYFPVNFAKFLRTPFLTEYLWWLLLKMVNGCSFLLPGLFLDLL